MIRTAFTVSAWVTLALLSSAAGCSSQEAAGTAGSGGTAGAGVEAGLDAVAEVSTDAGQEAAPDSESEAGCVPSTCVQLGANCGQVPDDCGGVLSCGECTGGKTCGGGGQENQCGQGDCQPSTCAKKGAGCGMVADGCGGVLECGSCTSPETCGGGGIDNQCGCKCALSNAATSCSEDGCALLSCEAGFLDCNSLADDGCEAELAFDSKNCGGCGTVCSFGNASGACVNGQCWLGACNTGYANCDSDPENGCEVNTLTDPDHCNKCNQACPETSGTAICTEGTCGVSDCNPGLGECDETTSTVCETNLMTDWGNCGACGNACSLANASPACVGGECAVGTCNPGYGNCDGDSSDGCETSLLTSPAHCGSCSLQCASLPGSNPTCVSGHCGFSCAKLLGDCDLQPLNGCETSLSTTTNCGSCGHQCILPNAKASCSSGTCVISACSVGYGDCNKSPLDGCEANFNTDPAHCGSCTGQCMTNYVCTAGSCTCPKPCGAQCCGTSQKCCNAEACVPSNLACPDPK